MMMATQKAAMLRIASRVRKDAAADATEVARAHVRRSAALANETYVALVQEEVRAAGPAPVVSRTPVIASALYADEQAAIARLEGQVPALERALAREQAKDGKDYMARLDRAMYQSKDAQHLRNTRKPQPLRAKETRVECQVAPPAPRQESTGTKPQLTRPETGETYLGGAKGALKWDASRVVGNRKKRAPDGASYVAKEMAKPGRRRPSTARKLITPTK